MKKVCLFCFEYYLLNINCFNILYYTESEVNRLGIGSIAELPTAAEEHFSESDDSDKEDEIIKPNDNLILVGRVDGDASILEIHGTCCFLSLYVNLLNLY